MRSRHSTHARERVTFGLLLVIAAAGCGPSIQVVRMGATAPAKGPRCGVTVLRIDAQQVGLGFETLGSLMVQGDVDDEAQRALEEHACSLGGDYLVPAMAVGGSSTYFVVKPRPGVAVRDGKAFVRVDGQDATRAGGEPAKGEAATANRPIVAVAPIEDRAGLLSGADKEELALHLATQMVRGRRYRVVPPDQARARLAADKRESYRQCYDSRCQIELGKALAAEKTLATRILRVGDQCSLALNLYDLKTETAEAAASRRVPCTRAGVRSGLDGAVAELAGAPGREP